MEVERGSNRSHSLENSLWKRLRTRRKAEYNVCKDVDLLTLQSHDYWCAFIANLIKLLIATTIYVASNGRSFNELDTARWLSGKTLEDARFEPRLEQWSPLWIYSTCSFQQSRRVNHWLLPQIREWKPLQNTFKLISCVYKFTVYHNFII
jgi:hypothetical protein